MNLFFLTKKVNAKKRFSQTEIYPPRKNRFFATQPPISADDGYTPIVYTCSNCGYKIEFKKDNFLDHHRSRKSNLYQEDTRQFDETAKKENIDKLDFLDFYCPKCKMATRVFYETYFGGDHGDTAHSLKYVLEKKK